MFLGCFYAFIVSFLFSLYLIPRKISKHSPTVYTMFMGLGFFVPSIIYAMTIPSIDILINPLLFLSFLVGVIWMVASVFFVTAIDKLGLSRSNQWKNIQGPIGAGLSLWVLSEYQSTNMFFVLIAIASIFISAVLFSIKKENERVVDPKGIWFAIIAGILFGVNSVIQKYVTVNIAEIQPQQLCFSFGVFSSALTYLYFKEKNLKIFATLKTKNTLMSILAGLIYFVASQFSIMANKLIPNSIAFTIIQFNAVWTICIGIIIFKEIDFRRHWKRISLGLVFAFISIGVLFLGIK